MTLYWGARRPSGSVSTRACRSNGRATIRRSSFIPSFPTANARRDFRSGLVHEVVLEDHAGSVRLSIFYMSGPPTMIDAGRRTFVEAGLPEERLYYDSFDYAPDVLAEILRGRAGIHDG